MHWNYGPSYFAIEDEDNLIVWRMYGFHQKENEAPEKPEGGEEPKAEHRRIYEDPQYRENQDKLEKLGG